MRASLLTVTLSAAVFCIASPVSHAAPVEQPLTRLQFVQQLVQDVYPNDGDRDCFADIASTLPPHYTHLFNDVQVADPGAKDLCLGMLFGFVDGNPANNFRPHDAVNVAEAAKMITQSYGIALPDSVAIRKLGWHWRYTEALKRSQVIPWYLQSYNKPVTLSELRRWESVLTAKKPPVLRVPLFQHDARRMEAAKAATRHRITPLNRHFRSATSNTSAAVHTSTRSKDTARGIGTSWKAVPTSPETTGMGELSPAAMGRTAG